jgi:rfaE bifunctional protein nucleotidyltransferase chain/domain
VKNVISPKQIKHLRLKAKDQRLVLVGGVFDIVHPGHVQFLEKAKKEGDILVLLLESDQNVKLRKGLGKPVNSQDFRAKVVASLKAVDFVVCLPFMESDEDYDQMIKVLDPAVIATTKGDPGIQHKKRQADMVGGKLKAVVDLNENYSTKKLIQKIQRLPKFAD